MSSVVADLPQTSKFAISTCMSWKGPSVLCNVDLSISLFSTLCSLIGTIFSLFLLNGSMLFSARLINFKSFLSSRYLDF